MPHTPVRLTRDEQLSKKITMYVGSFGPGYGILVLLKFGSTHVQPEWTRGSEFGAKAISAKSCIFHKLFRL